MRRWPKRWLFGLRRVIGLPQLAGSDRQADQQLSVWVRHLTETGDWRV